MGFTLGSRQVGHLRAVTVRAPAVFRALARPLDAIAQIRHLVLKLIEASQDVC
jgi:hypothetical protein